MVRRSDGPLAVNVNPNSGMQSPRESSGGCCTGVHAHTHACAHTHTNMRSIRNYWSCAGLIDFSRVHATLRPHCWSACRLVRWSVQWSVRCWLRVSKCVGVAVYESGHVLVTMPGSCQARALPRAGFTQYRRCQALVAKRQGRDLLFHTMPLSNTLKFTINYYVVFETILLDIIRYTSISLFFRILSLKPPFASHHFWILLPHEDISNKKLYHQQ